MKLSTRSRYGTRVMLDMAEHYQSGPIQLRVIAGRQGIPVKYLEQIIIPLKKAGYVNSVRGFRGGYVLARPPEAVTVGEIVVLLEGGLELTACMDFPENCERAESCVVRTLWQQATAAMYGKLNAVTLADLVKQAQAIGSRDIRNENSEER